MNIEWRKATASGPAGECVEVGMNWRKASGTVQECVEVAMNDDDSVFVRDSKNQGGPVLRYNHREWAAFLDGVKNGEFDL